MKYKMKSIYLAIKIEVLFLVGIFFISINLYAATKNQPIEVNVAQAKVINVPDVIGAVGHIRAIQQVNLSFGNSGKLQEKFFNNGDRVLKGEVIAKLDDTQDQADYQSLQAKLTNAEQNFKRMQILAKSGAVSKEVLDKNQTALVEAQTMLAKQKNVLEEDKLIAPFSGVLSSYKFDIGAYISSGTNVVELTQEAPLKVNYALSADYRPKISIGDKVTITSSTYPNKSFYGVVSYIAPTVNSATGTIDIEAKVPNKQFLLSPGMFVNVIQTVDSKRNILVVPDTSIQADQNGQYVFLVDKNDTVKKVYIKQGMLRDGWAQVLSPLKEGDTVVSIGGFKLNDGDHISISKIPPPDFNKTIKVQLTPGNVDSPNTTNSETTDKQTKDSSPTKKEP